MTRCHADRVRLGKLKRGARYVFYTRDFTTPLGECIRGESKVRTFLQTRRIGAVGLPKKVFLEVMRENGRRHLIAVETIKWVTAAPVEPMA